MLSVMGGTPAIASQPKSTAAFALAGVAMVGGVIDAFDVPHDNLQNIAVLGAGTAAGIIAGLVVARRALTEEHVERARRSAWLVVRLVLAYEMVRYGMPKIFGMQFYPQYWKLDLRAVDMDPKVLAWTFFGRSYGYQAIGGVLEIASGVLLCFPRTTLLGACVLAPVITDVVLVNFFYDVPVKLLSSVYLMMTIALIARDGPRLWASLFPVSGDAPNHRRLALRILAAMLVIGLPTASTLRDALRYRVFVLDRLEGAWRVDQRVGLDDLLPESPGPWQTIYFEKGDFGLVRIGKERVRFETRVDDAARSLSLSFGDGASPPLEGKFEVQGRRVRFAGEHRGTPFSLDLTREIPR